MILDSDLAEMYGVETKRLKEQVKRNISRFPPHFMFELTKEEYFVLRSQFASLKQGAHSKYLPYAFSEHGVLMLSNVLRSEVAIQVSIRIIDVFVKMREMMSTQKDILHKIEHIENHLNDHSKEIQYVFSLVKQLLIQEEKPRKKIGYKQQKAIP